ncbi:MAG: MFS transporter [Hyphomicrobiaceae bacterium]
MRRALGLFLTAPLYGISNGAMFPLIVLALSAAGASDGFIGAVQSTFYMGGLASALTFGFLVRLFGYRISYFLCVALGALAAAAFSLPLPHEAWLGLRFLYGYAGVAFYVVIDAWIGGLATLRTRGRMLGIDESLRIAFMVAAPYVTLLVPGPDGFLVAAGAMALAALPVVFVPEPARHPAPPAVGEGSSRASALGFVGRNLRVLVIASLAGLSISVGASLGALYAKGIGFSQGEVATYLAVTVVAGAVSQVFLGAAADRFGRMRVLTGTFLAGGAFSLTIALIPAPSFPVVLLFGTCVIGTTFPLYALTIARLIDVASASEVVAATSLGLIAYTAAASFGPLIAGHAMGAVGPSGYFLYLAVTLSLGCLMSLAELTFGHDMVRLPD